MSIIRRLWNPTRARAVDAGGWGPYADGTIPPPTADGIANDAGVVVNERTALQHLDVYSCVGIVADAWAQLPVAAHERRGEIRVPVEPQPPIMVDPGSGIDLDPMDWRHRIATSLLLRGNAYVAWLEVDGLGRPTVGTPVHPDDVTVYRGEGHRKLFKVRGQREPFDSSGMMHIPGFTVAGELEGLSPIGKAARSIGLGIATERFGARWYADSAAPSSVLETDEELADGLAEEIQAEWIASHGGRRRPAVLTGGLKWRPVSLKPDESQFLATRKLNTTQIARLFRVPPHMIGDVERSTSWGKGIEEQGIGFVTYTLGPWITRFEQAISRYLPPGQYARVNVASLLRGNARDRYLSYAVGRQWGWMSVNDIRRLEDLSPITDGDTYLQPLNMVDAGDALRVLLGSDSSGGDQ